MGTGASVPKETPSKPQNGESTQSKTASNAHSAPLSASFVLKDDSKPSQNELIASLGMNDFLQDEASAKPISNNKLKKMALGIQGYKDKDRDYDQTLNQLDVNKGQKMQWSEPKTPEKQLTTKSSKDNIAWELKQETNSPSLRPYSNSRGMDFSPLSTLQPKSSTNNVLAATTTGKPAGSGPPPGVTVRPFPGSLSNKSTAVESGTTTPNRVMMTQGVISSPPSQQFYLTPVSGPGNIPVRPFGTMNAFSPAPSSNMMITTSNKTSSGAMAPMMMAIPPNSAKGSAPVQVPVGNFNGLSTPMMIGPNGVPLGAVPIPIGAIPMGTLPVSMGAIPIGGLPNVLVPASPAGVLAVQGPSIGPTGPRGPAVGTAPLPVVKETKDVKRNKAQLPSNLTHAKPTTGDWLNKRYIVNNYILLDVLGTGSYGEVRLCKDRTTERLYAIKIISKDFLKKRKNGKTSETYFEDIKREIAIMKKLLHPNILRLFEVLDDPKVNKMYLVLEYMKKGDLINILKKRDSSNEGDFQPLSDLEVWQIFRQLIAGIRYLHFQNIVHGDIKPQNLLLGDDGIVKIADFGISQMLSGSDEQLHDAGGTPAFMAPELCEGKKNFSGQLADIWAMGASIFMLRFGDPPFVAKSIINLYYKICNDPLIFPSIIDPGLQNLIEGMLEKNPDKRLTIPQIVAHPWYRHPPAPPPVSTSTSLATTDRTSAIVFKGGTSAPSSRPGTTNANNTPSKPQQQPPASASSSTSQVLSVQPSQPTFQPPPSYDAEADEAMKGPIHRTALNNDDVFMSIGNISMSAQDQDNYEDAIGDVMEEGDDDSDEETTGIDSSNRKEKVTSRLVGRSTNGEPTAPTPSLSVPRIEMRDKFGRKMNIFKAENSSDENEAKEETNETIGVVLQKENLTMNKNAIEARANVLATSGGDIMETNWGADVFQMVDDDDDKADDLDDDFDDDQDDDGQDRFDSNHMRHMTTGSKPEKAMTRKESHSEMSEEEEARRSRRFMKKITKKSTENMMRSLTSDKNANPISNAKAGAKLGAVANPSNATTSNHSGSIIKSQSQPISLTSVGSGLHHQHTLNSGTDQNSLGTSSTSSSPYLKPGSRSARGDPTRTFSMNSTFDDDEPEALTAEEFQAMMDTLSQHNTQGSRLQRDDMDSSNEVIFHGEGCEGKSNGEKNSGTAGESVGSTPSSVHNTITSLRHQTTDQSIIDSAMAISWEEIETIKAAYVNNRTKIGGGFHSEQGIRPTQEDRCVLLPNVASMQALATSDVNPGTKEQLNMFALAGIFDGHDGWRSSQYVSQYLATMLVLHDKFLDPKQMNSAINDAFTSIDLQLCDVLREEEDNSGSTAVVAIYDGRKKSLTVAGAGDSICVLCRNGHAIEMNKMHRITDNASERDRVKNAGGKIINNRVNGVLAVSRSFGDTPFKTLHELQSNATHNPSSNGGPSSLRPAAKGNNLKAKLPLIRLVNESLVTAVPEIYTELITPQTEFALLASDGLWDTMSPQLAISFVREHLSREKDLTKAAQAVVQEALRRGSIDNVTVLILSFNIGVQQN